MKINLQKQKGFTLVETLVVLGLVTILFGLGARSFSAIEKEDRLQAWADEVEATLSLARAQAISGASLSDSQSLPFGVYFSQTEFILFPGETYPPQDSRNFKKELPQSLYFSTIDLPAGENIVFQKITGEVINFDPNHHQLILQEKNSQRKRIISINQVGVVEVSD